MPLVGRPSGSADAVAVADAVGAAVGRRARRRAGRRCRRRVGRGDGVADEGADLGRVHLHGDAVHGRLERRGAGRDRDEADVAAGHAAELRDQPVEVPAAVEHDVPGDRVDEPADRARVGQRPGRQHPARHAGEERLLAGDAVEVAVLETVALPDEGQRVRPADRLRPGRQVDARPDLPLGPPEADRHAADRLGHLHETGQVDLGVVVDGEPGELLDRLDQRTTSRVARPAVELGTGDALLLESGLGHVGGRARTQS